MGVCLFILAKLIGIKTVHHYRTNVREYINLLIPNPIWRYIGWHFQKLVLRVFGNIIVPSKAMKEELQAVLPKIKVEHIVRGVDVQRFNLKHRHQGGWEKTISQKRGFRVLYVGRVSKEKNLDIIEKIYARLIQVIPNVQIGIVGDGPYLSDLKSTFKNEQERVFFTGILKGDILCQVFADADVFLFPSHTDTFGNSVAEALASGLPCVVSNRGGPAEMVHHGKNGFICTYDQEHEFLERLEWLYQNPEELQKFKVYAVENMKNFSHSISAGCFWDFYMRQFN